VDESILAPRDFESHPAYVYPGYGSSVKRGPTRPLIPLKEKLRDQRVPVYGAEDLGALDHDLTRNAVRNGEPLGERITVTGRVLDEGGRPVRNTLAAMCIRPTSTMRRWIRTSSARDAA
jgi:protocatechuate 3,4-dioxygenase beta subunit